MQEVSYHPLELLSLTTNTTKPTQTILSFALASITLSALSNNAPEATATSAPRFSLSGYASTEGGTTGGKGGPTNTVSTAKEFRVAVGTAGPFNILVSGPIDLGSNTVKITANKTDIGLGSHAGFTGHIFFEGVSNIILRNLSFTNPQGVGQEMGGGDGMTANAAHHVWVDHCDFSECADGQFDITHGSDFFTVSWCKFSSTNEANDHRLSMLIGNKDTLGDEDSGKLHVTLHHHWIGDLVQDRTPRVRFGQVHVFNNYHGAKDINTCIGLGCGNQVLAESCDFDGMKRPWRSRSEPNGTEGPIQWNHDNVYNHPKLTIEGTNSVVFKPTCAYKLDAGNSVKDLVMKNAGVGQGPFAAK